MWLKRIKKGWKTCFLMSDFYFFFLNTKKNCFLKSYGCLRGSPYKFSGFCCLNFCFKNIKKGLIKLPFKIKFFNFYLHHIKSFHTYIRRPYHGGAPEEGARAPKCPPPSYPPDWNVVVFRDYSRNIGNSPFDATKGSRTARTGRGSNPIYDSVPLEP